MKGIYRYTVDDVDVILEKYYVGCKYKATINTVMFGGSAWRLI